MSSKVLVMPLRPSKGANLTSFESHPGSERDWSKHRLSILKEPCLPMVAHSFNILSKSRSEPCLKICYSYAPPVSLCRGALREHALQGGPLHVQKLVVQVVQALTAPHQGGHILRCRLLPLRCFLLFNRGGWLGRLNNGDFGSGLWGRGVCGALDGGQRRNVQGLLAGDDLGQRASGITKGSWQNHLLDSA